MISRREKRLLAGEKWAREGRRKIFVRIASIVSPNSYSNLGSSMLILVLILVGLVKIYRDPDSTEEDEIEGRRELVGVME